MKTKTSQFGLLALIIFTGAISLCLAIYRLPLKGHIRIFLIESILLAFLLWAVHNRPTLKPLLSRVVPFIMLLPFVIYSGIESFQSGGKHRSALLDTAYYVILVLAVAPLVWFCLQGLRWAMKNRASD